jgi:hypothetical protein
MWPVKSRDFEDAAVWDAAVSMDTGIMSSS